jgi:hypothetical protein
MTDLLALLRIVTERLDAAHIPYMVSGSLALGYYAQPRMTRDIDIVVEVDCHGAGRLIDAFQAGFYCDADSVMRAVQSQRMVNVIHLESAFKIDFVIRKATPYRQEEFRRRRLVRVDGFDVWMVSPEDLLLSKLVWAAAGDSDRQRRDAASIVATKPGLDWDYLRTWAAELGVDQVLARCQGASE